MNLKKNIDLIPNEINPLDPAMRATAYNPFGKLIGKPYLKTPSRVDEEIYNSMNTRYQNDHTDYPVSQNSNTLYNSLATPRTFRDYQTQKAMYLGTPGQKFTSSKFIFIEFIIKNNNKQFKYSTFTLIKWSQFGQWRTTTGRMAPTGSEEYALRIWEKITMKDLE